MLFTYVILTSYSGTVPSHNGFFWIKRILSESRNGSFRIISKKCRYVLWLFLCFTTKNSLNLSGNGTTELFNYPFYQVICVGKLKLSFSLTFNEQTQIFVPNNSSLSMLFSPIKNNLMTHLVQMSLFRYKIDNLKVLTCYRV